MNMDAARLGFFYAELPLPDDHGQGFSFVRIRQFRSRFFSVLYGGNRPLYIRYKLAFEWQ